MVYLHMRGVHYHAAVVHEQWPPERVLALKEAKNASGSVNREIIKMLDKCRFDMVNDEISVVRTFCLSEPQDFWSWPKGFG